MIEASNLSRRYGDFQAVDGISFAVDEGEIVGMLGPNGAGKTTTLRMITGFLPPSAGEVTVAGMNLLRDPLAARRQIGYLPENVALYGEMRVEEYLSYRASLQGMDRASARGRIGEVLDRCLLVDVRRQIIGTLSKGYRQRVGLATAILHDPKVLVLDEPTVGLDPKQIVAIRELIRELGQHHTLLLSTHILPEVELLCDRVMIIDQGRIVAQGTPDSLRRQSLGNTVLRVTIRDGEEAPEVLTGLAGVVVVRPQTAAGSGAATEGRWLVECERSRDLREEIFRTAVARDWVLLELAEERTSLEDIFVRLTADDAASGADEPLAAGTEMSETPPAEPAASEEEDLS